jgi:hypothetical protein
MSRLCVGHPVFMQHRRIEETNMRKLFTTVAVALTLAGTLTAVSAQTFQAREPQPQSGSHSTPSGGGQERPYLAE